MGRLSRNEYDQLCKREANFFASFSAHSFHARSGSLQFAWRMIALSGFFTRKNSSTASDFLLGFQPNHSSEPGFLIVGLKSVSERAESACASSTHAMSKPSRDLIDSAV
jgi:hypothetical protein